MKEWYLWLKEIQHEWWFYPASICLIITVFLVVFGIRIGITRLIGRIMTPRMRGTDDQVSEQWATPADLERFGLVKPMQKKGVGAWIKS